MLPAALPVTIPVEEPTLAVEGLALVHVPPGVASVNVSSKPVHTVEDIGVMAAGVVITVTCLLTAHVPIEYDIVATPAATPVTDPAEPTVAMAGVALLHVPPETPSVSEVDEPTQTVTGPVGEIVDGAVLTVTTVVIKQPEPTV